MRKEGCPYCGKDFPEDYAAELCPAEDRNWKCGGCGKEYTVRIQPRIDVRTYEKSSDSSSTFDEGDME